MSSGGWSFAMCVVSSCCVSKSTPHKSHISTVMPCLRRKCVIRAPTTEKRASQDEHVNTASGSSGEASISWEKKGGENK
jgi:hypothetical protein